MKMFGGLRAYGEMAERRGGCIEGAKVGLITVTGPGVEAGYPWDPTACKVSGPHEHSGEVGCVVVPEVADLFNARCPSWWSKLHAEAARNVERSGGAPLVVACSADPAPSSCDGSFRRASAPAPAKKGADAQPDRCPRSESPGRPGLLLRVYEFQKRGLLHVHPVVAGSTPRDRRVAEQYVQELSRLAPKNGFGFVGNIRWLEVSAAAAYLSSYFVGGKGRKMQLTESVTRKGMPRSIVYMRPELSQASGLTMRTLRLRRFLWHRIGPAWLRLLPDLGLDLETTFEIVRRGYWGRAFINTCLVPQGP